MLCEKCNQNKATIHMQEMLNGEKSEFHLCQTCAMQFGMPINNFFLGLLEHHYDIESSGLGLAMGNEALEEISCPNCGLTYEEFRKTSNLGCSHCYRAFRRNLNFVIKNVQGSTAHKGKYPKINGKLLFSKKKILELKKLLAKSVEEEEYEQAARLRDEIRGLEALNND